MQAKKRALSIVLACMTLSLCSCEKEKEFNYHDWDGCSSELDKQEIAVILWCQDNGTSPMHWPEKKRIADRSQIRCFLDSIQHSWYAEKATGIADDRIVAITRDGQLFVMPFRMDNRTREFVGPWRRSKVLWCLLSEKAKSVRYEDPMIQAMKRPPTQPTLDVQNPSLTPVSRPQVPEVSLDRKSLNADSITAIFFDGRYVLLPRGSQFAIQRYMENSSPRNAQFIEQLVQVLQEATPRTDFYTQAKRQRRFNLVINNDRIMPFEWWIDAGRQVIVGQGWESSALYDLLKEHRKALIGPTMLFEALERQPWFAPPQGSQLNPANQRDSLGMTPLHYAVTKKDVSEVAKLVEQGADVSLENGDCLSPLHLAVVVDAPKVTEYLLTHGAAVDSRDADGMTALNWAALLGHSEHVDLLLKHNADVDLFGQELMTPLHWAACNGHESIVEMLVSQVATVSPQDKERLYTPLHWAVYHKHIAIVKTLLAAGANASATNKIDETPLHFAAGNGSLAIVTILLEADGIKVNAQSRGGDTPLHAAAGIGHADVVQALLNAGADPTIKNNEGETALDVARKEKYASVVAILE